MVSIGLMSLLCFGTPNAQLERHVCIRAFVCLRAPRPQNKKLRFYQIKLRGRKYLGVVGLAIFVVVEELCENLSCMQNLPAIISTESTPCTEQEGSNQTRK